MYIYKEFVDDTHHYFDTCKVKNSTFTMYKFFYDLKKIFFHAFQYPTAKHIFLLDEERFDYFRFDMFLDQDEPITITGLRQIIEEKIHDIKQNYHIDSVRLFSFYDSVHVDNVKRNHLIGAKGKIFFRLCLVFLKVTTANIAKSVFGQSWKKNFYFPKSFFTVQFVHDSFEKDYFFLLYINEIAAQLVSVQNGFYHSFKKINLGSNMLKSIFQDNNILQYFYQTSQQTHTPVIQDIIKNSCDFYTDMLSKWLFDCFGMGQDIIIVSHLLQQSFFLDSFASSYIKYANGFILPFHYSKNLKTFGRDWNHEEMDILILLNSLHTFSRFSYETE